MQLDPETAGPPSDPTAPNQGPETTHSIPISDQAETLPGGEPGLATSATNVLHTERPGQTLDPGATAEVTPSDLPKFDDVAHRRVGAYVLQNRIGAGGQGEVWRAVQLEPLIRVVALKLLSHDASLDPDKVSQFRKEAERGGKLAGPSILPVYDFGLADGRSYIAMPLVNGFSLSEVLEQRRLWLSGTPLEDRHLLAEMPEKEYQRELCVILARVARALSDAHSGRILHRDVKPGNILLDRSGGERVYLSDFGLAHDLDNASTARIGFQPGTPIYMAPERLLGKPEGDGFPSDIFSLGATLYEALTLHRPFTIPRGLPIASWPSHLASSEPPPPRVLNGSLPRDIEAVTLKAMDPNLSLRYQTAGDLAADLERFARGEPVLARKIGPLRQVARKLAKRRRLLNVVAVVGIVLATLGLIRFGVLLFASNVRHQAREAIAREQFVDAGRLVSQSQALDPSNDDTLALTRSLARAMIEEAQNSADNSNVDQALQWYRSWAALNFRRLGADAVESRTKFAQELGLLDLEVTSEVPDTVVTFQAVRADGRPRALPPLYEMVANTAVSPSRLEELVDGLYWVTARVPATGAFVEFLYQPPPGVPTNFIEPLRLYPRTDEEARQGMVRVKGGTLVKRTGGEIDPNFPAPEVKVADFFLDPTEVTNREFAAYIKATLQPALALKIWPGSGRPPAEQLDWPVTRITYDQARDYAAWRGCRLPSEDELEWAARGERARTVPEGAPPGWVPEGPDWLQIHPVKSVALDQTPGESPIFGLYGNAGELTLFRYRPLSLDISQFKRTRDRPFLYRRRSYAHAWGGIVVRSGLAPTPNSSAYRPLGYTGFGVTVPDHTEPSVGFRCARSIVPLFTSSAASP